MAFLYTITHRHSGKIYVGITDGPIAHRWNGHRKSAEEGAAHCRLIARALKKHGVDAFDWEVTQYFDTIEEAKAAEVYWIERLGTNASRGGHGYNLTDGGDGNHGWRPTEETRRAIGAANRGRRHTAEARRKMSVTRKGRPPCNAGKPASEATKKKMSSAHKGRVKSEEHRRKIGEGQRGRTGGMTGKRHSEETKMRMRETWERKRRERDAG